MFDRMTSGLEHTESAFERTTSSLEHATAMFELPSPASEYTIPVFERATLVLTGPTAAFVILDV